MVTTHRVVRGTSLTLEFEALNFTPKDTGTFVLHVSKIPNDSSGPYVFTIVKPYSELTDDDIDGNIVTVNLAPDSTNLATGKYFGTLTYQEPSDLTEEKTLDISTQQFILEITARTG